MRRPAPRPAGLVCVLLVLGAAALSVGSDVKANLDPEKVSFDTIIDPTSIPGLHLGVPGLLAGLLYLRTNAHAGVLIYPENRSDQAFAWLAQHLQIVAKLENRLLHPAEDALGYLIYMSERPHDAHRVLLRTLLGQTGEWRQYFWIGYLYYALYNRADKTIGWWRLASLLPGSPEYLPNLVQLVRLQDGGTLDPLLLEIQRNQIRDPVLQREFDQMLEFERKARVLNRDLIEFHQRYGRPATDPQELVVAGIWPRIPTDPWGGAVAIDAQGQRVLASDQAPVYLQPHGTFTPDPAIESGAFLRD